MGGGTADGAAPADGDAQGPEEWDRAVSLQHLRARVGSFVAARGWEKFHRPRSLALALVGEIGELCELFQWRGDEGAEAQLPDWTEAEKERLGEELSDVLYYTVRLADRCGIDLAAAAERKMEQNIAKYPADRCFGSSAKYTAYQDGSGDSGGDASK